ncbi:MAG: primosomal protein N' [Betaproteobacteria bacterium]|nr:MAG: primosomal protein N' [Betaproteobacteria bacterium]
MTHRIAQVALDIPLARLFDYLALDAEAEDIGRRVIVPFGKTMQVGVLIALTEESEIDAMQLKAIAEIDRRFAPLPAALIALARFAADYYHHPFGATLINSLPPALRQPQFRLPPAEAYRLTEAGRLHAVTLAPRATAQHALAAQLAEGACPRAALSAYATHLPRWLAQGWIAPCALPVTHAASVPPPLTEAQTAAVVALRASMGFAVHLLYGITGSGKTEVYLQRCADVVAVGRQALILVPEIHLTPQLTERVAQRFPHHRVVLMHSVLSAGERLAAWLSCLNGEADIVLGTRLAVFAPLTRLGLIVVDEEHDSAYKQGEGLRYSARDLAIWRARQADAPCLLGSATPALESWHNAQTGRYQRHTLAVRARSGATLPAVRLIDTRTDRPKHGLSRALDAALEAGLTRGEQSLVFINRRGYAPVQVCNACQHIVDCPRCAAHQVVHRHPTGYRLRCHHCGHEQAPPQSCPNCGSRDLRTGGQGTQRIEERLVERFPAARILRVDRDTASKKGGFAAMREAIARHEVDIIVGTQILAKGHDFPDLTQVGVIGADSALQAPDFRAGERLFAQLMQVGGRAGRAATAGTVWVQTDWPRHPLFAALHRHDYPGFAAHTLRERQEAGFPPFMHLAVLRADAVNMAAAMAFLVAAQAALAAPEAVAVFDPVPALIARVAHRERAQLLLQSTRREDLQAYLRVWIEAVRALPVRGGVRWSLDVDPAEF